MSVLFKAGAGLMAGVVAGGLGYCFWPRVEPSVLASRHAVEKPVFVVASVTTAPPIATFVAAPAVAAAAVPTSINPTPAVAAAVQPAVADKGELNKLAAALKARSGTTRGLAFTAQANASASVPAPSEEAAKFCADGLVALAAGDIASARLFLQRAADAGDARALMALGDSYDAPTLARLGVVGMRGDAGRAREYYAQALAAGVDAAKERIASLESRGN